MGFTLQSLTPSQSLPPFGVCALMLFLATRSPALRTRRLRCPAAPGLYSPQGSVPDRAEAGSGRYSLGLLGPLQSVPRSPWGRLPVPFPPALPSTALGESGGTALQGIASDQVGRTLAGRPTLLRFSTRTCPRLLPTTVFLSVTRPEVSQPAAPIRVDPKIRAEPTLHWARPPEGSRRISFATLRPVARRPPGSAPRASPRARRPAASPTRFFSDDPKTAGSVPAGHRLWPRVVRAHLRGSSSCDPKIAELELERASPETAGGSSGSIRPGHLLRSEDRRVRLEGPHRRPGTHSPDGLPRLAPHPSEVASVRVRLGSGGHPPGASLSHHIVKEKLSSGQALSVPVPGSIPRPQVDEVGKTGPVRPSRA